MLKKIYTFSKASLVRILLIDTCYSKRKNPITNLILEMTLEKTQSMLLFYIQRKGFNQIMGRTEMEREREGEREKNVRITQDEWVQTKIQRKSVAIFYCPFRFMVSNSLHFIKCQILRYFYSIKWLWVKTP